MDQKHGAVARGEVRAAIVAEKRKEKKRLHLSASI